MNAGKTVIQIKPEKSRFGHHRNSENVSMDIESLCRKLGEGYDHFRMDGPDGYATDYHCLRIERNRAVAKRHSSYEQWNIYVDRRFAEARVGVKDIMPILQHALISGSCQGIVPSVNSVRFIDGEGEEGRNVLRKKNYRGKAKMSVSISPEGVKFSFLPNLPRGNTSLNLAEGIDYFHEGA